MSTLHDLRAEIDRLDAALVYIVAQRFHCTEMVGEIKRDHRLPTYDGDREERQKARLRRLAEDADISYSIIEDLFETITDRVKARHDQLKKME